MSIYRKSNHKFLKVEKFAWMKLKVFIFFIFWIKIDNVDYCYYF